MVGSSYYHGKFPIFPKELKENLETVSFTVKCVLAAKICHFYEWRKFKTLKLVAGSVCPNGLQISGVFLLSNVVIPKKFVFFAPKKKAKLVKFTLQQQKRFQQIVRKYTGCNHPVRKVT